MYRRSAILPVLVLLAATAWPAAASAETVTCRGRAATIVGTSRGDVLEGTPGPDVIAGRGGSDVIRGHGGDDLICGGAGSDHLYGGRGNDRLYGGLDRLHLTDEGTTERIGDALTGGSGNDHLFGGRDSRPADDVSHDAIYWNTARRGVMLDLEFGVATGQGIDHFVAADTWIVGSSYGDDIEGTAGDDLISGGPGDDFLIGYDGDDRIIADDALHAAAGGADEVRGGRGDDQITAGAGRDELHGGPGADVIDDMAPTADVISGGKGADKVFDMLADVPAGIPQAALGGGGARDFVAIFTNALNGLASPAFGSWNMATGTLTFELDHPVLATVSGFEQADITSFGATWLIEGTTGGDQVSGGGTAQTTFLGRAGDDVFTGSAGDDTFAGGQGIDHSLGMGAGDDTCISVEIIDAGDCESVTP